MVNVDFFHERLGRLKVALRAGKDKEVAEALGLSEKAFNARKARNSFPEKELRALAQQRPELGIDVDYVLTGGTLTERQQGMQDAARQATQSAQLGDQERDRLLAQLEQAGVELAKLNAARTQRYMHIVELLNDCTDDTVELVSQTIARFRLADAAARLMKQEKAA